MKWTFLALLKAGGCSDLVLGGIFCQDAWSESPTNLPGLLCERPIAQLFPVLPLVFLCKASRCLAAHLWLLGGRRPLRAFGSCKGCGHSPLQLFPLLLLSTVSVGVWGGGGCFSTPWDHPAVALFIKKKKERKRTPQLAARKPVVLGAYVSATHGQLLSSHPTFTPELVTGSGGVATELPCCAHRS